MNTTETRRFPDATDTGLTRLPGRIDFGEIASQAFCRVVMPIGAPDGGTALRWEVCPTGSGFLTDYDGESIIITPPTSEVGRRIAYLKLFMGGIARTVDLSINVLGSDPIGWPEPMGVDQARTALKDWVSRHPVVPRWLFDGELTVRDATVIRVTMTAQCETTESATRYAQSLRDLPAHESTADLDLDAAEWEGSSGEEVLGVPEELACQSCDESHRVPCPECSATGVRECPVSIECDKCHGSGKRVSSTSLVEIGVATLFEVPTVPDHIKEQCPKCEGKGHVSCATCNGKGERVCTSCDRGRATCPVCGGHGSNVRFRVITRTRTIVRDQKVAGESTVAAAASDEDFRTLAASSHDLVERIPAAHAELKDWVCQQIHERRHQEVARQIRVEIVPAAAVTYAEGNVVRTAYLVGDAHEVVAPGAATPSVARVRDTAHKFRDAWRRRTSHG